MSRYTFGPEIKYSNQNLNNYKLQARKQTNFVLSTYSFCSFIMFRFLDNNRLL